MIHGQVLVVSRLVGNVRLDTRPRTNILFIRWQGLDQKGWKRLAKCATIFRQKADAKPVYNHKSLKCSPGCWTFGPGLLDWSAGALPREASSSSSSRSFTLKREIQTSEIYSNVCATNMQTS